ncbi:response regulator transcription factor [Paenibacillus sp. MCAF9]|uniref:response regulator transcription factor n=1 Tax=Paenibacillus sp. MCAF9 TaxID=3233046 RepID=UPI003F98F2E6
MKLSYEVKKPSHEAIFKNMYDIENEDVSDFLIRRLDFVMQSFAARYRLTQRESEILILSVVYGFTNREISEKCVISEKTVKNHLSNLMNKIGARSMRKLFSLLLFHALSS